MQAIVFSIKEASSHDNLPGHVSLYTCSWLHFQTIWDKTHPVFLQLAPPLFTTLRPPHSAFCFAILLDSLNSIPFTCDHYGGSQEGCISLHNLKTTSHNHRSSSSSFNHQDLTGNNATLHALQPNNNSQFH